jgi:hypothetical protein
LIFVPDLTKLIYISNSMSPTQDDLDICKLIGIDYSDLDWEVDIQSVEWVKIKGSNYRKY